MTLFYPDISNFQGAFSLKGAPAVCILATQGTGFTNPVFAAQLKEASQAGAYAFSYHFLEQGNGAGQAHHYFSVAGKRPCMIDAEVYKTSNPTPADVIAFATTLRALGGVTHLCYLPEWYWSGHIGSPSLHVLKQAGLSLVSSDYPTAGYSENGQGWNPYGGATPSVWQYTDVHILNGVKCDYNAFKGTLAELKALVSGTTTKLPSKHLEDPEMNIAADEATKTISWVQGSAKGLTITCGSQAEQAFEVTFYAENAHAYVTKSLTVQSGRSSIDFPKDKTYMVFLKRTGAPASWTQVWAHTY